MARYPSPAQHSPRSAGRKLYAGSRADTSSVAHWEQDITGAGIELTPQEYAQIDGLREQREAA